MGSGEGGMEEVWSRLGRYGNGQDEGWATNIYNYLHWIVVTFYIEKLSIVVTWC